MRLKEKFAQFLNDEVGSADHHSLFRLGTLAIGSAVASLMIQAQADADFLCHSATGLSCEDYESCCVEPSQFGSLYWCSFSCPS